MSRLSRIRPGIGLVLLPVVGLLAGCGLNGVGLPGGADLGDHPYHVTAQFADVLDLVPQASVRLNDVPVGRVEQITLSPDGSVALVSLEINGSAVLPADTRAELRAASLLGEKFVELEAQTGTGPGAAQTGTAQTGRLRDGAVIPVSSTRRYPEVEEVFGALSLLLNGGGLAHLQDIIREVNTATGGNEPQLRDLMSQLAQLTGRLNTQRGTIVAAIDGLDRLSGSFAGQSAHIATALDQLGPGLAVLRDQRSQLVTMLKSLDSLSGVATDTVNRSRDDLLADLRALTPTLRQLAKAGSDIPNSLQLLLSYPFPDYAMKSLKGDYFNTDAKIDIDLDTTLGNLLRSSQPIVAVPGTQGEPLPGPLATLVPNDLAPPATPPAGLGGLLSPLTGGGR